MTNDQIPSLSLDSRASALSNLETSAGHRPKLLGRDNNHTVDKCDVKDVEEGSLKMSDGDVPRSLTGVLHPAADGLQQQDQTR